MVVIVKLVIHAQVSYCHDDDGDDHYGDDDRDEVRVRVWRKCGVGLENPRIDNCQCGRHSSRNII